jgi:DNA adenine methylase
MSPRPKKEHELLETSFGGALKMIADEKRPAVRNVPAKPFVKWVGGKRSILPILLERLPPNFSSYHEPFIGGGALYFAIQPERAILSDINNHLVFTYIAIRDDVERLVGLLQQHKAKHSKSYFVQARNLLTSEKDETVIASLFIYLNKTCFNGLYRVNKGGGFNVPLGSYKNPAIADEDTLLADSAVLQGTEVRCQSFTKVRARKGAFFYLDPPYHQTYDGYSDNRFGDELHQKLADKCETIHKKGGYFMLSNSDTAFVRNLYAKYDIEEIQASRSVSCKPHQRGKANELLIRNY